MLVQIFGAIDLIAAGLLYFGEIPGPEFIIGACIMLLFLKGIISMCPVPIYLPGLLMSATDAVAVLLLYFGTTQIPSAKTFVIVILLVKSLPSLISALFLVIGFLGSKKEE